MKYVVAYAQGITPDSVYREEREYGETIEEIISSLNVLPERFKEDGSVFLNGYEIPRELWSKVRPKATEEIPVSVTLHLAPRGGDAATGTAKAGLALLTGGLSAPLSMFGGSTILGMLGKLALSIGASLLLNALSKPPTQRNDGSKQEKNRTSSIDGNSLEPGQAIPRVIGTHKVYPPFVVNPLVSLVGDDEYIEAVFGLAGPHKLQDIKAGEVDVLNSQDISVETREGWPTDTSISLVTRQSYSEVPQLQLSAHDIEPDSFLNLADQTTPINSLPIWHTFTTRQAPDEFWISLNLPSGLYDGDTPSAKMCLDFRIRFRQVGSATWINGPQIRLANRKTTPIKKEIRFLWRTGWSHVTPTIDLGWQRAYRITRTQTASGNSSTNPDTPAGYWIADNYFSTVANTTYNNPNSSLYSANTGTTEVRNVRLYYDRAELWLDPAVFPKGQYEVQIKRSIAFRDPSVGSANNYLLNGAVLRDPFFYSAAATNQVTESIENRNSDCYVTRAVSVWNEHPCPAPNNLALIAIKAKNRQLPSLSTLASGYVKDWNGAAWATWTTTSNPAPHYYDVLAGSLNFDPLPTALIDSTSLVNWRTRCATKGYQSNLIVDAKTMTGLLDTLAGCGYARAYKSEVWGVVQDDDKSAQAPVQVFSPKNSRNFKFGITFNRANDALRVTYRDKNLLYTEQQFIEYDTFGGNVPNVANPRIEQIDYQGLVTSAEASKRAKFDLAQYRLRNVTYSLDVDIESILCRQGDLVAVQHDVITTQAGFSRILAKVVAAGNITGFTTYEGITLGAGPNAVSIRRFDGSITTHQITQANGTFTAFTFVTPFADTINIDDDCLVVSGPSSSVYKRLIVTSIQPSSDFTATMTLVDEAPSLQTII